MRHFIALALCFLSISTTAQGLAANINPNLLDQLQSLNTPSQTLAFEENKGQVRDQNWQARQDVLFSGVSNGLNFHLRNGGISYQIVSFEEQEKNPLFEDDIADRTPAGFSIYRVDLNWINSNQNMEVVTGKPLTGYTNYYNVPSGQEPALMVQKYQNIRYRDVWPGIDLLFFSNKGVLESDWLLDKAERYTQIAFEIAGAEVRADDEGYLIMQTPFGEIREGKLAVYQNEKLLDARWVIEHSEKGAIVRFDIDGFEPEKPMRIDPPTSLWSTLYGGTGKDEGQACTSDGNGNLYMSGRTNSTTSIATTGSFLSYALGGSYDAFIVKFNSTGVRQWATYYGWSGWDEGAACTTDNLGNVFLAGRTNSTAMVGSDGAHQPFAGGGHDAFLVKFNTNGVRQWGTFYGGTGNDMGTGCTTDSNNNVYLTGKSLSSNNIGTPGSHQQYRYGSDDAFIVKFTPGGVRQWGTYFGGDGQDVALAITAGPNNKLYMGGYTSSSSNIATPNTYQPNTAGGQFGGFLTEFNTDGAQQWGTYYSGTSGWTWVRDCATDASGNIYFAGLTQSPINIATPGSHQQFFGGGSSDGFLAKMDNTGNRIWGTYIGGGGHDEAYGCAIAADGVAYVAGSTASTDGIAFGDATQPEYGGGNNDAFLTQFDADGNVLWSSYFGGSGNDVALGCAADASGIYMTGFANSSNVFASPGAHQPGFGGGDSDAFFGVLESAGCTEAPAQPANIQGDASPCEGANITYSVAEVAFANSYTWTLPNGWTGSSTTTSIDVTAGNNGGAITVSAVNNCGSSAAQSLTVSVDGAPNQPGAISGETNLCAGDQSTFSVAEVAGASSYTWTLPNGWTGSSTTTSIDVTAGNNGGTITVSAVNSCGSSATQSLTVSVDGAPNQPGAISGETNLCAGDQSTFSIAEVAGASSYTWTLPNGWTGSSTTTSIDVTAGNNGGTITVSAVNSCGSSATQSLTVSVDSAPNQPGAISGDNVFCAGDQSTFSIAEVAGASSYVWTLPNGWTGSTTTTSIDVTAGNNGGTITVSAINNCGSSSSQSLTVSVNSAPNQPGAISGDNVFCAGDQSTFSIAEVAGASSYVWTLPNGWTGSTTTTSIDVTAGNNGGTITVSAINNCGSSSSQSLTVSVNSAPNQPGAISGDNVFCAGDQSTFSIAEVAGASSYTWTLPNGWTGSSTTTSIDVTAGNNGGTITVSAVNNCGSSSSQSLTVSVNSAPNQPGAISGDNVFCAGDQSTFSIAEVAGASSYVWTLPNGWTGSTTTTSIDVTAGNNGGTITVSAINNCGSSAVQSLTVSVDSAPNQPEAISGDTNFCAGDQSTFSVAEVAGASSYTWTLPNGWTGSSTTTSIDVTAGNNGGTITVSAVNNCGSSSSQSLTVSVNSAPNQPGAISGDNVFCAGDQSTFSIAEVAGASSYVWTLPNGWTGSTTTTSIDVTAGNNGGTITVSAINNCGSSSALSLTVSVNSAPNQPGAISGDNVFCAGDQSTFSIAEVAGASSYTWTLPNGWTGSSTTTSIDVTAGNNGGTITVSAVNNCGSSSSQSLTVSVNSAPNQPGAISGDNVFCAGDQSTFSIAEVAGASSYTWTLPNGWTGSSTTTSIDVTAGNNGGTITVSAVNNCGSSAAQSLTVSVDSAPNQPGIISGDTSFCAGDQSTFSIAEVAGASSYTWTLPNGWTGSSTTTSIDVTAGNSGGTITVSAVNNCGSSAASAHIVDSHALPVVTFELDTGIICNSYDDFALTGGLPEGGIYTGTGVSDNVFSPTEAGLGTHLITYTYTDENECSQSSEQFVTVDACTGIDNQVNDAARIYPNPFCNSLVLEFEESRARSIEFHNAIGQIVHTLQGNGFRIAIDTEHLAPGIYFIKISGEKTVLRVVRSN